VTGSERRTLLAACSGVVLGWVSVYSVTGCTADSSRVESGAWWHCPTSSAGVFPPTRRRGTPTTHRGGDSARTSTITDGRRRAASPASRLSGRDAAQASAEVTGDGLWVGVYAGGAVGEGTGGGWVAGGRLAVLSSLRHGAAGVRWVESRVRSAGEAAMMRRETTDEAMGMLVRRFPAVVHAGPFTPVPCRTARSISKHQAG
jgi:hypothetical protein